MLKLKHLLLTLLVLVTVTGCRQKVVDDAAFDLAQKPIVLSKCKAAMTGLMVEMNGAAAPLMASGGKLEVAAVQALGSLTKVQEQCGAPEITDPGTGVQVVVTLFKSTEHQCTLTAKLSAELESTCS